MHRTRLKHLVLAECSMDKLLSQFTYEQVALVFNVPVEFVKKTDRLQRVILEKEYFNKDDEMKLGRRGAWTLSKERKVLENNFLLESQIKTEENK